MKGSLLDDTTRGIKLRKTIKGNDRKPLILSGNKIRGNPTLDNQEVDVE